MVTAEELTVAIRSEGAGETRDQIEGVEGAMNDTAESAGATAEEVGGLGERISGVMSAAVAALAVGAAGLMSQIPVLGQLMSSLIAVVQAVAFQMDSVLRPVLGPVSNFFFELSNAIFEAEGAIGTAIGVFSTLASIAGIVGAAMLKFGVSVGTVAAKFSGVIGAIKGFVVAVGAILGVSTAAAAALVGVVAAVVAFAAAFALNIGGIRDTTIRVFNQIKNTVVNAVGSFISNALDALGGFASRVASVLTGVASAFADWASSLASDAFDFGRDLIQGFINGIQSLLNRLRGFLSDLRDVGGAVGIDVPSLGSVGGGGGGGGGGTGRARGVGGASFGGSTNIVLDGRKQSEDTGRYRADPGRRRGL